MQDIRKLDTSADALRNSFDPYAYSKTKMYMYSGEPVAVFLRCHKMILNDVIDQFGQEIILPVSYTHLDVYKRQVITILLLFKYIAAQRNR